MEGVQKNQENYVTASQTNIKESNLAGFAEIEMPWGNFSFDVGLRLELKRLTHFMRSN